ncbi:MAG: NnrS family protein [bacterium]
MHSENRLGESARASLRGEPYRLFFPLAIVIAFVGVGHWLAYAHGWSSTYSGLAHSQLQAGGYVGCFVLGFLMTALPRNAAAPPASFAEVGIALAATIAQVIALSMGAWIPAIGAQLAIFVFIAYFAARRFRKARASAAPPVEFVWLPLGIAIGSAGCLLAILGMLGLAPAWLQKAGLLMAQQGFVISVVLGVGGFLAPRLMGHRAAIVARPGVSVAALAAARRRRVVVHCAAAVALLASLLIEGAGAIRLAYLLRAAVVTAELAWTTRLFRRPAITDVYVKYLWMSLWSLTIGLWAVAIFPAWRVAMLHFVFVGGFSLMTFAIGTMVVLSHAGESSVLRGRLPALRVVGIATAVALIVRLIAETQLDHYFAWLGAASTLWLLGAAVWIAYITPRLLRVVPPAVFERAHEEAKSRILQSATHSSGS